MSTKKTTVTGSLTGLGLLLVAFSVLKLCKVIDWSWWWVLSPIWAFVLLFVAVKLVSVLVERKNTISKKGA